jgi:hypothetical protein
MVDLSDSVRFRTQYYSGRPRAQVGNGQDLRMRARSPSWCARWSGSIANYCSTPANPTAGAQSGPHSSHSRSGLDGEDASARRARSGVCMVQSNCEVSPKRRHGNAADKGAASRVALNFPRPLLLSVAAFLPVAFDCVGINQTIRRQNRLSIPLSRREPELTWECPNVWNRGLHTPYGE